jgi:hypothetical protein
MFTGGLNIGGFGGFNYGGLNLATVSATDAAGARADSDSRSSIFGTILNTGSDVFKTILGYKIATQQVQAGQYPTAIGQNGNMSGTANIPTGTALGLSGGGTTWLLIGLGLVVLVMLVKR